MSIQTDKKKKANQFQNTCIDPLASLTSKPTQVNEEKKMGVPTETQQRNERVPGSLNLVAWERSLVPCTNQTRN